MVEKDQVSLTIISTPNPLHCGPSALTSSLDPLPSAELHNILQEFTSHLPDQDGKPLSQLIPLNKQGQWEASARRGVAVKWVMGYTVVSSSRNVVEDKG